MPEPVPGSRPIEIDDDGEPLRAIAVRHSLELVGFDREGVDLHTVREIASALGDLLAKYPIPLCGIEIGEPRPAHDTALWIVLDQAALGRSPGPTTARPRRRWYSRRFAVRAVYTAVVREYARALDRAGDLRAREKAWQILLTESLRGARSPYSLLDPAQALVEGFTEVELRGKRAEKTAKLLHETLTKTASWPGRLQPDESRSSACPPASQRISV